MFFDVPGENLTVKKTRHVRSQVHLAPLWWGSELSRSSWILCDVIFLILLATGKWCVFLNVCCCLLNQNSTQIGTTSKKHQQQKHKMFSVTMAGLWVFFTSGRLGDLRVQADAEETFKLLPRNDLENQILCPKYSLDLEPVKRNGCFNFLMFLMFWVVRIKIHKQQKWWKQKTRVAAKSRKQWDCWFCSAICSAWCWTEKQICLLDVTFCSRST